MSDFIFILFTISVITGLIYFLYKMMLGSEKSVTDSELQITSKELLAQITILHKQKKNNIVESLAKTYLAKKPADDDVRTLLAKALFDMGKIYDAIEEIKIIIKHKPKDSEIKIFLSNCYVATGKPMKSIEVLQDILEYDYNNVVAVKELAQIYFDTNQKQSSIKMYKRLEELLDNNFEKAKIKAKIAEIHIEFRDYQFAIDEYDEILEIYPEDIKVKKRLVELHKLLSDYDSAIEAANEILQTCSEGEANLWALKQLMDIYYIMQNYSKAMEYANIIKEHPMSDKVQTNQDIANILLQEGQVEDSIEMLKVLAEKEPQNILLKKSLAFAYERNNDFEVAVNIYKKILDIANVQDIEKIHFEISDLYANWGLYLFSQDNIDDCFKKFVLALEYYSKNSDVYFKLGNLNKTIKNFNEAISQYKKAIELNQENFEYYSALADCYQEIDSVYEQKKALIECLKYNDNNSRAHFRLGVIFNSQNDSSNAMLHIKRAIELDNNFVEAQYKLALMLEHKGNREEAIQIYEDILRLNPENEEVANNLRMLKSA